MDENNLFLKKIEERARRAESSYAIEGGDFLTMEEQSRADRLMKSLRAQGAFFYGGYSEAERKIPVFMPDYTGVDSEEAVVDHFIREPEECPLIILDLKLPKQDHTVLSHRDYLGALMAEGIKREKTGDILVRPDGAQVIVLRELAEYLKENIRSVGRASVSAEILTIDRVDPGEIRTEDKRYNVPSPRLDNVVSAVFSVSRKAAVEAISRGLVFVDGIETVKPDQQLRPGQKIVLRGKGKAFYLGGSGTSRKGKIYIDVRKYI